MTDTRRLSGIYAVLPSGLELDQLLQHADAAMQGGVRIIQLRDKDLGFKKSLQRARKIRELTRAYGARFIMNDSLQLAQDADADGVHLGRDDMQSIASIRADVGSALMIGASCQGDAAFARHVLNEGADYVSFGAIFPTESKQDTLPIGLERLAKARQIFPESNICAIGGITLESIPAVRQAGADCIALIGSLFKRGDITTRARTLVDTWNNARSV
ncbi:MAG: thiamine phosphate synthase [Mariprofundaceae bacterium]|nr:thiamine phosphate synthase [Mariprofundaceae bacterium]